MAPSWQIFRMTNSRIFWSVRFSRPPKRPRLIPSIHEQPVAKKIAKASGATDYNILQNNGRAAHQLVDHVRQCDTPSAAHSLLLMMVSQVHFHVIPKPNEKEGLGISWPMQEVDMSSLKELFEEYKAKM
jgi:hypothetical protein